MTIIECNIMFMLISKDKLGLSCAKLSICYKYRVIGGHVRSILKNVKF